MSDGVYSVLLISSTHERTRNQLEPVFCSPQYKLTSISDDQARSDPPDLTKYQLVLVELVTGSASEFLICEQVRRRSRIPMLLLTSNNASSQIIRGYAHGADAYVVTPYDGRELLARAKGLLWRLRPAQPYFVHGDHARATVATRPEGASPPVGAVA